MPKYVRLTDRIRKQVAITITKNEYREAVDKLVADLGLLAYDFISASPVQKELASLPEHLREFLCDSVSIFVADDYVFIDRHNPMYRVSPFSNRTHLTLPKPVYVPVQPDGRFKEDVMTPLKEYQPFIDKINELRAVYKEVERFAKSLHAMVRSCSSFAVMVKTYPWIKELLPAYCIVHESMGNPPVAMQAVETVFNKVKQNEI